MPAPMPSDQLARADKETTDAAHRGDTFTRRLALLDLRVYATDKIRPHASALATRWGWTEKRVRSVATPSQLARPPHA